MSKYILVGIPVSKFLSGEQESACWLIKTQQHANILQRQIGSAALRYNLKVECVTYTSFNPKLEMKLTLVAKKVGIIKNKKERFMNYYAVIREKKEKAKKKICKPVTNRYTATYLNLVIELANKTKNDIGDISNHHKQKFVNEYADNIDAIVKEFYEKCKIPNN